MSQFIEKQGQSFADSFNDQIINTLINEIDSHINLSDEIAKDNERITKEHNELLTKIETEGTPEFKEEMKDIKLQLIEFKSNLDKFQYAYSKLIASGKAILHEVDSNGTLIVKVYIITKTSLFKFKATYAVDLKPIETTESK